MALYLTLCLKYCLYSLVDSRLSLLFCGAMFGNAMVKMIITSIVDSKQPTIHCNKCIVSASNLAIQYTIRRKERKQLHWVKSTKWHENITTQNITTQTATVLCVYSIEITSLVPLDWRQQLTLLLCSLPFTIKDTWGWY